MSAREAKQVVRKYAKKLSEEGYSFSSVYLFGSALKSSHRKESDIDVAVVTKRLRPQRNFEKNLLLLWKLRRSVDTRIEPHGFTPEEFNDSTSPLVHEIKKTGVKVF